ncbi:heterokaryon incompatibility protein-domain-containing protein [Microdochium trichocladiopsis]|uniref:Heterokaryon incompatibility protein-domain-containing protein n=1 Tax=Microdochium trichocladiopsis TaxID=1682393 RepID=A0A9P8XV92_9PEZI|nr:heterokaryon incompatibility protein-domain-containing protein [Microdochium trichocladiopsis]KAH7020794.1 heterokaryon incompatibility protein-domain-containing protein [Microdochium trichocladiopsis]
MRLLSFDDHHNLLWTWFPDNKVPPYAILSHTWGDEEVTFADLISGRAHHRLGYKKIVFCGEQAAAHDALEYFWVDSCCIDKESSAELSEAIISMFRWYERAAKCYVYLSDVSASSSDRRRIPDTDHPPHHDDTDWWIAPFRESRWFDRGWTLQELLAPRHVEFFSAERQRLGDKDSLALLIHDITKIPLTVLRGQQALETISIEERRKWTVGRETTKPEDLAYCQLGIFGVWMVAAYGEGEDSARRRLDEEIDKLPYTEREARLHSSFATAVSDHYYTIQENDDYALEAGYRFERVECFVWSRREPGTVPVYQYLGTHNGDHFYTRDADEGHRARVLGYVFEKVAFYTCPVGVTRAGSEMRSLGRFLDTVHGEHFYTAEEQEQRAVTEASFQEEEHIGFVFPGETEQTVPLYRWYKS